MTTNTLNTHASAIDSRRGSALLIVVGTLALIAVFAAIYISIGQSDQRVAQSVRAHQQLEEYQNTIADHILGVIADDRLDYTTQRADTGMTVFAQREVTDAPYTDWTMLSESANEYEKYNPSGRHSSIGVQPAAIADFRVASDPWLASTSPTYLGDPGEPILQLNNPDNRPFGSVIRDLEDPNSSNFPTFIAANYSSGFLDNRDWLQISNLAPDGRFVNLFNLRPNAAESNGFGDARIGGFDSEPGTGHVAQVVHDVRRMSEYLSLWDQEIPADPNSRIVTVDPESEGIWLPGRNAPELGHGLTNVNNSPAVWTMYQRFAFLPLNQPFMTVNRNRQVSTWADPDYAPYQWADADGDGMADARWFELTSAQLEQSSSTDPRTDIERLYDAGQYRLFAAARVVDLSSMVNVNTAMDQLATPEPDQGGPIGATPADVDLRRLLSMNDPGNNYSGLQLAGLSPSNFHKPVLTTNNDLIDSDYKWYRNYIDPVSTATFKEIEPSTNALSVGRYAYNAIKLTIELGGTLDDRYYAWPPEVRETNSTVPAPPVDASFDDDFNPPDLDTDNAAVYRLDQFHNDPMSAPDTPMTALNHAEWYNLVGRLDPFSAEQSDPSANHSVGSLYNKDDLFELLAFHGLNDPASMSRLEKAAMGRMPSVFGQNQRAFSPLLSNRPLALDRERHGYVATDSNYFDPAGSGKREITGGIAKESMAFFAVTPRRHLTVVSGGSTIKPGAVIIKPSDLDIDPALLSINDSEVASPLVDALGNANTLFNIYSDALVGELNPDKLAVSAGQTFVLDPNSSRTVPTSTLFYGHKGPELALRIAAHAAVNMKDLNDTDQVPTAATIILDESVRNALVTNFDDEDSNAPEYLHYAGRATDTVFDPLSTIPDPADRPNNSFGGQQSGRKAVNVFGIEPMPFLTEVSSMYVYTDSALGDNDFSTGNIPLPPRPGFGGPVIPLEDELVEVTINGDVEATNPDFMMQIIAFQLTNPWDVAITLGNTDAVGEPMGYIDENNNTNLKFDYYIEFGGRFFKLGEFLEFNPPITAINNQNIFDPAEFPDNPPPLDAEITSADVEYQYRSTTIPAHSAKVFYAMAHGRFGDETDPDSLDEKWNGERGSSNDNDGKSWTGSAEQWVNRQFRVRGGGSATHIHQFNPKTGELVEQDGFHDLMSSPDAADAVYAPGTRSHEFTQARLWRKIAGNLEESTRSPSSLGAIDDNRIQNDLLVDRISITGADDSFDRKLAAGDNPIEGSAGYDITEYTQAMANNIGSRNDNFGLTIARWASVRRGDQNDSDRTHDSGQIGAWMLSSHRDPSFNTIFGIDHTGLKTTLLIEDFLEGGQGFLESPFPLAPDLPNYGAQSEFLDLYNLNLVEEIIHTLARNPRSKYRIDTSSDPFPPIGSEHLAALFPELPIDANSRGDILHAVDSPLRPELLPTANGFNGAPRLADLLLAWGIGPTYTPDPNRTSSEIDFDPEEARRWITLSEALAIGLGYETDQITYTAANPDADNIWIDSFTADEQLFDNGHLAIDNFVAYYNTDTSEAVPDFDVGIDIRRGTGVPMALGVIDQTRAITPLNGTTDLAELLASPTFGQININTAPVEVLRLLPGLSPSLAKYYPENTNAAKKVSEWWAINDTSDGDDDLVELLELPDLSAPEFTPDVAAAIVGYRDRTYVQPRFRSTEIFPQENSPVNYATANPDDNNAQDNTVKHATNLIDEVPVLDPSTDWDHRDRQSISGIDGLRQSPGFGSLGEVFAVSLDQQAKGRSGGVLRDIHPQLSIQQFAHDTLKLDGPGDSIVAIDPQLYSGTSNGATVDDYAERLAIADGILNTISVRSDFYAVWFVVHAYQESDVANLQPEDPLVPSIAKRYVMVVDRTNVKDPGDTPKVVFLREVPM